MAESLNHHKIAMKNRLKSMYPKVSDPSSTLPSAWSPKDKFSYIGLSNGGLRVQFFKGHGDSTKEGATVKTNNSIHSSTGVYYFEIKILSKGREGNIAVGLATSSVCLSNMPGNDKHSFAYHSAEGTIHTSRNTKPYGPSFTTGDVIGCGLNFVHSTCFFTKNGHYLGVAFKELPLPAKSLYPVIGLHAVGAVVEANFGNAPFLFDIDDVLKEMKSDAKKLVCDISFPANDSEYQEMIHKLVSSYLLHNGFCSTAQQFAVETGQKFTDNVGAIQIRRGVLKLISRGRIKEAIEMTEQCYPGLLKSKPDLLFRLKCRQFIEMINSTRFIEFMETDNGDFNGEDSPFENIVEFGRELYAMSQDLFKEYGLNKKNKKMLRNAFSLLAYSNPHESPIGWQLDPSQRELISVELNCAILENSNASLKPPLELALAHVHHLLALMSKTGIGVASFIDVKDYL